MSQSRPRTSSSSVPASWAPGRRCAASGPGGRRPSSTRTGSAIPGRPPATRRGRSAPRTAPTRSTRAGRARRGGLASAFGEEIGQALFLAGRDALVRPPRGRLRGALDRDAASPRNPGRAPRPRGDRPRAGRRSAPTTWPSRPSSPRPGLLRAAPRLAGHRRGVHRGRRHGRDRRGRGPGRRDGGRLRRCRRWRTVDAWRRHLRLRGRPVAAATLPGVLGDASG